MFGRVVDVGVIGNVNRLQFWLHFPRLAQPCVSAQLWCCQTAMRARILWLTTRPMPFLETVINFRSDELLGECLLDTELGRLALTCHFALDCLGDLWGTSVEGDGYSSEGYAREDVFVTEW